MMFPNTAFKLPTDKTTTIAFVVSLYFTSLAASAVSASEASKIETQNSRTYQEETDSQTDKWIAEPRTHIDIGPVEKAVSDKISSGPRYILEKIVIIGNKKTLGQVILRHVDLVPGESFATDDIRISQAKYRLLASGLFYNVELSLGKGTNRGHAVLFIKVAERNTIVLQDIVLGFSDISKFYGSIDAAEKSLLGTGVKMSAAVVFSLDGQFGYRLRLQDDYFLNSPIGIHMEGLYSDARDFFGRDRVCVESANEAISTSNRCAGTDDAQGLYQKSVNYAVLNYRRAGVRLGTGYTFLKDNYFYIDYRAEVIAANVPKAGYHWSFGEYRPIEFGHLLWGHSFLSSIIIGVKRDTRNSMTLTSKGARTALEIELSSELIGSDYEFAKFTLSHSMYFPLLKTHTIGLNFFGGLIMGDSPFFNQFFVGDFSAFVPSRVLEMNFSHLQPNLLGKTMIREMRYEDIAAAINLEYALPFYRGHGIICGINGFVSFGFFFLASRNHLKYDPKGYSGAQLAPIDLTADIGIKVDTKIGMFVISLANLLRLVPGQGAAEE